MAEKRAVAAVRADTVAPTVSDIVRHVRTQAKQRQRGLALDIRGMLTQNPDAPIADLCKQYLMHEHGMQRADSLEKTVDVLMYLYGYPRSE